MALNVVRNNEAGNAILFLFIAVALFGALSYTFLQNSRGSTALITGETGKAATYKAQDCANTVAMGMKRLQSRGCTGATISLAENGGTGTGPTDGSCTLFHPNGGGVKPCGADLSPYDTCSTGPIGSFCVDGAFYVGEIGGVRRYAAGANLSGLYTYSPSTALYGTASTTDGPGNTDKLVAAIGNNMTYAAVACRAMGPKWYLPARDEQNLVVVNSAEINPTAKAYPSTWRFYVSSTEGGGHAFNQRMNPPEASFSSNPKNIAPDLLVRCFRR